MEKIRVGIIGTGFSAISHIEALRRIPRVDIRAIVSRDENRVKNMAEKYGIPTVYTNPIKLIEDQAIDAIHNCTPNHLHYTLNKKILKAGKHLLSEKPLSLSSVESAELSEMAKASNVVSGICFNYRHYPLIQQAKATIASGEVGRVFLVHGGYLQDWLLYDTDYNWRLDPNINGPSRAMADIGSHWCDTVQHILGKKIIKVFADLQTVHKKRKVAAKEIATFESAEEVAREDVTVQTEDCGNILFQFEDGTKGVFTISQVSAGRKNHFHFDIAAQHASLSWNQEEPNKLWIGKRNKPNIELLRDPELLHPDAARITHYPGGHQEGWPDGLKNLFIDFYTAIENKNKEELTFATFEDGHQIMLLIEAILQSHQTKQWVNVPSEFTKEFHEKNAR